MVFLFVVRRGKSASESDMGVCEDGIQIADEVSVCAFKCLGYINKTSRATAEGRADMRHDTVDDSSCTFKLAQIVQNGCKCSDGFPHKRHQESGVGGASGT